MSTISHHIKEGILHITNIAAYDHMLFLLVVTIGFTHKDAKRFFLLATAFTVGHSITLLLSGMGIIHLSAAWIELAIALSIMITAIGRFFLPDTGKFPTWRYGIISVFGLIHGMGFSNHFRMLYENASDRLQALLFFNLGVEVGQLIIIAVILILTAILQQQALVKVKWAALGIAGAISAFWMWERWPL